jgi:hypothetical protein
MAKIGKRGGRARAAALTPAERRTAAQKAINARWEKARLNGAAPKAKK